jgi:type I restriction enzyme S subunit
MEVQREIVNILKKFNELEDELEVELEAELGARQQQLSHYRDSLLSFSDNVSLFPLREVCDISRGRVISKNYLRDHQGTFPVYSSQTQNQGIFGYVDTFEYDFESVTWTTDGANAGSVFYHNDEQFSITNVCGLLKVKSPNFLSTKYLYHQLGKHAKSHVSAGMGNPKLMANAMGSISIPIPSLEKQEQITDILDKLDALMGDLSVGLPAEVAARRQQYEHYRVKLLTFREKTA